MLCFSRDSEILAPVTTDRSAGGQVIHAVLQGKPATLENTLVFPPSGVIPFHGFTMYGKKVQETFKFNYLIVTSIFLCQLHHFVIYMTIPMPCIIPFVHSI